MMFALLLAWCFNPGTATAQVFSLTLNSGEAITVNAGPTICQPTGATINWVSDWSLPYAPENGMSSNVASYHKAVAGTKQIIVDIPIPAGGTPDGISVKSGYIDGSFSEGFGLGADPNSPPGIHRYIINAKLPLGNKQGYIFFSFIYGVFGQLPAPIRYDVVIPFVVEGPTVAQVESLGTVVEPQMPYLVLHAPPGDGSSSEFQQSKTTCRELVSTYAEDNSNAANLAVKLGVAGSLGFIATVDFEFSVTFSGGVTAGDMVVKTSGNQTCVTVNEGFETSDIPGIDGGGDVFIGYGTDLNYGIYPFIEINQATCNTKLDTGLIYTPVGLPRKFAYTKTAILSEIEALKLVVADSLNITAKAANTALTQLNVWNQVLAMNDANVNNPDNALIGNLNFSSGVNSSQESSITVTETNSINYEQYLEGTFGVEAVIEVGGSGVTGGYEYKSSKRYGATQNQTAESAKLVRYTLADNDGGDIFNVDVVRDPMFGTPAFRVITGTKSSCPYQGGYQRDQPALKHTGQAGNSIVLLGNPVGSSATFNVDVCNTSNEARSYTLKLNPESNLNGAVVTAAGFPLNNAFGQSFNVPANGCLPSPLVVEVKMQSAISPLSYPDLELILEPSCADEGNISSNIFASVYFGNASSVIDLADNSLLAVYPNPTSGLVHISLPEGKTMETIRVQDFSGRTVRQVALNGSVQNHELDLSGLPRGIYGLQVQGDRQLYVKKVVVE